MNGLLLLLLGTAALQAHSRLSADMPKAPPPMIGARVGEPVSALVRLSDSTRARLSEVSSGSCRLVVVYSPDCAASLDQAVRWTQDAAADPEGRLLPEGWKAIWVSAVPTDTTGSRLPQALPVQVATVDSAGPLAGELGLRAYPAHLVLDREGRVREAGMGATLPRLEALRPDCTINSAGVPDSTEATNAPVAKAG